ncbi:hypothetical protein Nepgr_013841 [Nepenthes gracilis]|uniref:Uncharacterized protein n=1 Tax=Nepenthes gracilis TaxID=150966 RepID=A0AAD3XPT5_NEPGR|nr:hypothetical protein Nepgr_013841 [Nepenthes gracilis]
MSGTCNTLYDDEMCPENQVPAFLCFNKSTFLFSSQNILATSEEGDYADHLQSPAQVSETMSSGNVDAPSSLVPDINDSNEATGGPQQHMGHTSTYSFGSVPPMLGNPLAQFEGSETQGHDVYRIPGSAAKELRNEKCGKQACLTTDNEASGQQVLRIVAASWGNSVVLSTSGQAPHATRAAGVTQNPIAVNQQAVPVF